MSHTEEANPPPEIEEPAEVVRAKVKTLAKLIATAKHPIAFSGAGVSTAAGIPDFRGPTGAWTLKARGEKPLSGVPVSLARPTFSHMAVRSLYDLGVLKYITAQNTDGLHLRSGVPPSGISELHGDTYLQVCWTPGCGYSELLNSPVRGKGRRDFCAECRTRVPHFCHCTLSECPRCAANGKKGVALKDSIIHFGENLDSKVLGRAFAHAGKADFCLVLGSSCKVTPAADIPKDVGLKRLRGNKDANLVIVNLQPTPLDPIASLVIRAKIDNVMAYLMEDLGLLDCAQYPWTPPRGLPTPLPAGGSMEESITVSASPVSGASGDYSFPRGLPLVKSKMSPEAFEAAKKVTDRASLAAGASGGGAAAKPSFSSSAKAFTVAFPKTGGDGSSGGSHGAPAGGGSARGGSAGSGVAR